MKRQLARLRPLIGIALSALLVYFVLFKPELGAWFRGELPSLGEALFGAPRIGIEDLREAGRLLRWGPAIAGVLTLIASLFLRSWRWKLIIDQIGHASYWSVFHANNIGYMLNNILPLRAGELLRGIIVARRNELSATSLVTTVIVERVFDMTGLAIVFGAVLALFPFPAWLRGAGITITIAIIAMLGVALLLANNESRLGRWQSRLSGRGALVRRIGEAILRLVEGLKVLRSGRAMLHIAWSTLALWFSYIAVMKLVLMAFQFTDGRFSALAGAAWVESAALTLITALGFAIPSAPGGVGTYHGAVLLGLSWFDVPEGLAVIFAAVMHAVNYVTLTLAGFVSLLVLRLRFSELLRRSPSPEEAEQWVEQATEPNQDTPQA